MDCIQRYQKNKSFQFDAKGFAAIAFLTAFLFSCSHKTAVPESLQQVMNNPSAPSMDVTALGIQLTRNGDNDSPYLSEDGQKVVFVSRKRHQHAHSQIYLFDLENLKERRLTYQDGECRDPIILKKGNEFVYASSTDELKERPLLLRKDQAPAPLPPTDLYLSDLSGSQISRLTNRAGFDGLAWPRPDKPESILYSIWNGKNLEVHQLNVASKQSIQIMVKKDKSIESLRPSPDGKRWAWIEKSATGETQVLVGQPHSPAGKDRVLTLPKGDYKEVVWFDGQKLILNSKSLKKFYQFYSFDLTSECLTSLFDSSSDLSSPRIHRERKGLVFASSNGGSSQIFYKSMTTSDQCLKWQE